MSAVAFQDRIPQNRCYGCGPDNDRGLRIKSFWAGPDESVCRYRPEPHQAAGPRGYLNGGVIATLIDCHAVCTAIAEAYRRAGREIGQGDRIWYATASLTVDYLRPTPIDGAVEVRARIGGVDGRKTRLDCTLSAGDTVYARGRVIAVRVPPSWRIDD